MSLGSVLYTDRYGISTLCVSSRDSRGCVCVIEEGIIDVLSMLRYGLLVNYMYLGRSKDCLSI